MRAAAAAAQAIMRMWRHEVIRTLGGSALAYRVVVAGLMAAGAGWVLLAASAKNSAGLDQLAGGGVEVLLLRTTLNLALALSALVTVGLMVLVPEETALNTLLLTMPLRPVHRYLATDAATLGFGLSAGLLVSGPFVWLSLRSAPSGAAGVAVVTCWLCLSVAGVLLAAGLVRMVSLLVRLASRLPGSIARALAALGACALIAQQSLVSEITPGRWSLVRRLLAPLARAALERPWAAGACAVGVVLVGGLAWRGAAEVAGRPWRLATGRMIGHVGSARRARPRTLPGIELTQLLRHPTTQSTLVLLVIVASAATIAPAVRNVLFWPGGALLLLGLATLMAVGSYGATWTSHWIYRCGNANPAAWVGPKWLSTATLWLTTIACLALLFSFTPQWRTAFLFGFFPQLCIAFATSMVVGLAIPVSEQQPLSSLTAFALAGVAGVGVSIGVEKLSGGLFAIVVALSALYTLGSIFGYRRLAVWRERDLVF